MTAGLATRAGVVRFLIATTGLAALLFFAWPTSGVAGRRVSSAPGLDGPPTDTSPLVREGRPLRPPAPMAVASPGLQIVKVLRRVNHAPEGESSPAPRSHDAGARACAARGLRACQSALLANRTSLSRLCRLLL